MNAREIAGQRTNLCGCGAKIVNPYNQWKGECLRCERLREAEAYDAIYLLEEQKP